MDVLAGSTDVTTYFALRLSATGAEATGLTPSDMDLQYTRSGEVPVAKVDAVALAATNTAHTDNRAIEIDATDQPGLYRVDWPDAAFAAGAREVILTVKVATAFTEHLRVNLTPVPADLVQIGGAAQSATDLKDFADDGYDPSTNKIAGVVLADTVTTYTGNTPQTGDSYAIVNSGTHGNAALKTLVDDLPTNAELATALGTADDAVLAQVALVKAKTDNLPSDPADASDISAAFGTVNSTLAAIAGYIDTEVASILTAVDTEVAAIKAQTDKLTFDGSNHIVAASVTGAVGSVTAVVSANVTKINGTTITGDGSATPWGPV